MQGFVSKNNFHFFFLRHNIFCCCLCLLFPLFLSAQNQKDAKLPVQILGAQFLTFEKTPEGTELNKLVGDVRLQQGESFMNCDSAYVNLATNNLEAFGNVQITQPGGTQVQSEYLKYTGNTRTAFLQKNVSLTDGKNNLWGEELTYNLGTKIGTYENGGTLQSETTTLSSNSGVYNARTKDSRFTGNVLVTDPKYQVSSTDLGYNTESKVVNFLGPSVVNNDKSELRTSSGFWDAKREIGHFNVRSSIRNAEQYVEADTLDYNRLTGFAIALGNVLALDTVQKTTLYSGYASYNEISRELYAAIKPVLKHVLTSDSIYIRADTFYAVHVSKDIADTLQTPDSNTFNKNPQKKNRQKTKKRLGNTISETISEPAEKNNPRLQPKLKIPDTTMPRFYTGFHHVIIYSDSLQARCDSIIYSGQDSTMRLMYNPVAWSRQSQITGDTILLLLDSSKLKELFVPDKAFVVSRSGTEKAGLYDQVQGKTLTAFFEKNQINRMVVFPNAETIYFPTDESGAYLGVNEVTAERMRIFFDDQKISRIIYEQDVKPNMTPLKDVSIPALKLSRFQWREDERPKSKEELFY